MKSKRTRRTVRVSRTGTRLLRSIAFVGLILVCCVACSATSKISVKQNQGDQQQDVQIEHEGKLNNLSLIFNTTPVYGCSQK